MPLQIRGGAVSLATILSLQGTGEGRVKIRRRREEGARRRGWWRARRSGAVELEEGEGVSDSGVWMTPGRRLSVQVPEARPELTPRPRSGGELDTAPAGAGKRRSFSLTLVSPVVSPLATVTDGRRAREKDRQALRTEGNLGHRHTNSPSVSCRLQDAPSSSTSMLGPSSPGLMPTSFHLQPLLERPQR